MEEQKIIDFAKKEGYESAKFKCEWQGYKCYEPILESGVISYIGLPLMILVDEYDNIRMSTAQESLRILNEFSMK